MKIVALKRSETTLKTHFIGCNIYSIFYKFNIFRFCLLGQKLFHSAAKFRLKIVSLQLIEAIIPGIFTMLQYIFNILPSVLLGCNTGSIFYRWSLVKQHWTVSFTRLKYKFNIVSSQPGETIVVAIWDNIKQSVSLVYNTYSILYCCLVKQLLKGSFT